MGDSGLLANDYHKAVTTASGGRNRRLHSPPSNSKLPLAHSGVACYKHRLRSNGSGGFTGAIRFMSLHRSLRASSNLGAKRNVLKRYERVELLKKRGLWKAGDRVVGLRKTKPDA